MDPLGNIPLFMSVMKDVDPARKLKITFRELIIAYFALIVYLFYGQYLLHILNLTKEAFRSQAALSSF